MKKICRILFWTIFLVYSTGCSSIDKKNDQSGLLQSSESLIRIASKIDYIPDELMVNMKVSDTDLEGYVHGYYFVTIDGKKYRYKAVYNADNLGTVEELVYEFVENSNSDNEKHKKVYALKEYPMHEWLQCRCDEFDGLIYLLKYAPPLSDVEFKLEELKNDGFVIIEDNDCAYGDYEWADFIGRTEKEEKASVWICYLSTSAGTNSKLQQEPSMEDFVKATRDDYPMMKLVQIYFDGTKYICSPIHKVNGEYIVFYRDGYDMLEESYKYMVHLVDEKNSLNLNYESLERYVLSDEEKLTSRWIRGMAGIGESMPYVRFMIVYYKYQWKNE